LHSKETYHEFVTKWQPDPENTGKKSEIYLIFCSQLEFEGQEYKPEINKGKGVWSIVNSASITLENNRED